MKAKKYVHSIMKAKRSTKIYTIVRVKRSAQYCEGKQSVQKKYTYSITEEGRHQKKQRKMIRKNKNQYIKIPTDLFGSFRIAKCINVQKIKNFLILNKWALFT